MRDLRYHMQRLVVMDASHRTGLAQMRCHGLSQAARNFGTVP